jgi:hypothetical protein
MNALTTHLSQIRNAKSRLTAELNEFNSYPQQTKNGVSNSITLYCSWRLLQRNSRGEKTTYRGQEKLSNAVTSTL